MDNHKICLFFFLRILDILLSFLAFSLSVDDTLVENLMAQHWKQELRERKKNKALEDQ